MVAEFYDWYISEAYPTRYDYYQVPPFVKQGKTTYLFDVLEYEKRLRTISALSERFINESVQRLTICNEEMQKIEWEAEPEPQFNIPPCNYLWGDTWVGGQGEEIDGFAIRSSAIQSDGSVVCTVDILIDQEKFVRSDVIVSKQDNIYKIDAIALLWK